MAVTMNKDNVRSLIGGELGVSEWIRIEQARVNAFADTTEDHQFIHVDPERAAATPFGGTIAHGFLTLSLLPRMMEDIGGGMADAVMGLNYGFDKIRFLAPVKVNSRVRARAKLLDVQEKVRAARQPTISAGFRSCAAVISSCAIATASRPSCRTSS